ncbi:MAG: plastocyanin/azurin family copper-binding protein [Parcubacteria group bacterium]
MKIAIIIVGVIVLAGIAWFVFSGTDDTNTNTTSGNTTTNTSINRNVNSNINAAGLNLNVTNDSESNVNAASNANAGTTNTASPNTNTTSNQSVIVTASGFSPQTVTISVGQSVTWMNSDNRPHYVAPDEHPSHTAYPGIWEDDGSGNISSEELYAVRFNTAGTYTYHDHLNSSLTGTVVVQ